MSSKHPAVEQLHLFHRQTPGLWESFAKVLSVPIDIYWPTWCWAPAKIFAEALINWVPPLNHPARRSPRERAMLHAQAECFAPWRTTQGIYRLHPALLEELWATPLDGEIPTEALQRLPAWCVYIELETDDQPMHYGAFDLRGFWIHLSADLAKNTGLGLTFLDTKGRLIIYHLRLMRTLEESFLASQEYGYVTDPELRKLAHHALSVALYLCADATEVPAKRPAPPRWVQGKKRPLTPVAKNPEIHPCGYRIGAALDFAKKQRAAREAAAASGSAPLPHVRRAHWHTYWTGPRKGQGEQRPVLKWLHPILVGGVLPEEATLREVL